MIRTCHHYVSAALQRQYGGQDCQAVLVHRPKVAPIHEASALPFTGADIKLFVIVGLILLIAGIVLYRAGRTDRTA